MLLFTRIWFLSATFWMGFCFDPSLDDEWTSFKTSYSKQYLSEKDELMRRETFENNVAKITEHNARAEKGLVTFALGINQFTDWTPAEYRKLLGAKLPADYNQNREHRGKLFARHPDFVVPDTIDWRTKGYVTPVKDQGMCGSCWAFSTTGSLEGAHFKVTGNLTSLSEQNLVDCSSQNSGCNGGWMDLAFNYIIQNNGIDTEASYPYSSIPDSCWFNDLTVGATMREYTDVAKDENSLKEAVASIGPVSVAIDASHDSFMSYKSGIYNEPECVQEPPDHAVLVVGYGSENGQDYWIVKNSKNNDVISIWGCSWNTSWGEKGYIRMARNNNNMCGISNHASYPVV